MSGVLRGIYEEARKVNQDQPEALATETAQPKARETKAARKIDQILTPVPRDSKPAELPEALRRIAVTPENNAALASIVDEEKGRARPVGKRSDPDYERMTVLLKKETRRQIELRMLQDRNGPKDLSELAEMLFSAWVNASSS